jgi:hypothetical protein
MLLHGIDQSKSRVSANRWAYGIRAGLVQRAVYVRVVREPPARNHHITPHLIELLAEPSAFFVSTHSASRNKGESIAKTRTPPAESATSLAEAVVRCLDLGSGQPSRRS